MSLFNVEEDSQIVDTRRCSAWTWDLLISGEEGEMGVGGGAEGVCEGAVGVESESPAPEFSSSLSSDNASSSQLSATGAFDFLLRLDFAIDFGGAWGSILRFFKESARSVCQGVSWSSFIGVVDGCLHALLFG